MRLHACALVIATGCNATFGLDPTVTRFDAAPIDGPGCSDGIFEDPVVISSWDGAPREFEPAIRHDLLEIWAHRVASFDEIWRSTRSSVDEPFGPPVRASFSSTVDDSVPTLSGDGLRLLFLSDRGGGRDIWEVTRPSLAVDFASPRQVLGLGAAFVQSLDISFDGRTLYFTDSTAIDSAIYAATRPTLAAPFGTPTLVAMGPLGAKVPAISPDDLELFFNPPSTNQTWKFTRVAATAPFDEPPVLLLDGSEAPDLAADGRTLITARNSSLVIRQRMCP